MKRIISQLVFCLPLLLVGIALVLATAQIFWGILLILLSVVLFFMLKNVTDENLDKIIKGTILFFAILLAIAIFQQNVIVGSVFLIIPVIYGFSKLYANVSQRQEDLFLNNLTEQEKRLKNMNFVSNREIDILGTKVFKVDEKSKQIAICDLYSSNIDIIKFDEITDVELLENDSVVMKRWSWSSYCRECCCRWSWCNCWSYYKKKSKSYEN